MLVQLRGSRLMGPAGLLPAMRAVALRLRRRGWTRRRIGASSVVNLGYSPVPDAELYLSDFSSKSIFQMSARFLRQRQPRQQCVEGPDDKLDPRLSGQPVGAGSFAAFCLGFVWGGWLG